MNTVESRMEGLSRMLNELQSEVKSRPVNTNYGVGIKRRLDKYRSQLKDINNKLVSTKPLDNATLQSLSARASVYEEVIYDFQHMERE